MATQAAWKDAKAQWHSSTRPEQVTTVLLAFMILGGTILRIQGFGFPPRYTFDEDYCGPIAQHFLTGVVDLHDYHPPLSKLLGAIGILLFGYNSVGWRFVYLCFGLQTILIAYFLAREIFASRRAGWLAAAFVAADGFFIAYSRAALMDQMLTCFVLWSMLAIVTARTWRGVLATAVLVACAASVKWNGLMVAVPVAVALFAYRRVPWYTIFWFAATPIVHVAIWMIGLKVMGHESDLAAVYQVIVDTFNSQRKCNHDANVLSSYWYTWPLLYRPIVIKFTEYGAANHYASSAANVALFFPAGLLIFGLPIAKGAGLLRKSWRNFWPKSLDAEFARAAMLLALGWFALIILWAVTHGDHVFFYHYQHSYSFALVLLAGYVATQERRRPEAVLAFVALAVVVAIYYAPVWGEFSLTELQANRRLLFLPWRP
ncbi:MAG TPA: phospholipid carrier-dependent glycosyltransferase [Polyangia bacterium]